MSCKRYSNHVRNSHSYKPNFNIVCPVERCFQSYGVLSSLTSHISQKRQINLDLNASDSAIDVAQESNTDDEMQLHFYGERESGTENISVKPLALYSLKTEELNRLNATDKILQRTFQLIEQNENHLKEGITRCLQDSGIRDLS